MTRTPKKSNNEDILNWLLVRLKSKKEKLPLFRKTYLDEVSQHKIVLTSSKNLDKLIKMIS